MSEADLGTLLQSRSKAEEQLDSANQQLMETLAPSLERWIAYGADRRTRLGSEYWRGQDVPPGDRDYYQRGDEYTFVEATPTEITIRHESTMDEIVIPREFVDAPDVWIKKDQRQAGVRLMQERARLRAELSPLHRERDIVQRKITALDNALKELDR